MSLTWSDIERDFGADPLVAWDRDVAPLGWSPEFRVEEHENLGPHGSELWAYDVECTDRRHGYVRRTCKCVRWNGERWAARWSTHKSEAIRLINEDLKAGRVRLPDREWRREYLGRWTEPWPCPRCGSTVLVATEHDERACSNADCGAAHGGL